jgi:protein CpxP
MAGRRTIALTLDPLRQKRSKMRNSNVTSGFLSMVLALGMSLPAVAQSSTTNAPQHNLAEAPAQTTQSTPSQAAPGQAPAAPQTTPGNAPAQTQAREDNPLNLTDDQKAKLRPILAEENQQLNTLQNDTSMTQGQKVAKANEIRQAASPKIRAILTPEQLQKLDDLQKKANQQRNQSAPPDSTPAPQK